MKSVIVEGIDCSGKSTLIKTLKFKLKEYGGYDVKELEHKVVDCQFTRYAVEYFSNSHTLFDRSHISEIVYGSILRNSIPFSNFQINMLSEVVNSQFITVLASPSYDVFLKRFNQTREHQVIDKIDFNRINCLFVDTITCTILNPVLYKSSSYEELEIVSNQIIKKLINEE